MEPSWSCKSVLVFFIIFPTCFINQCFGFLVGDNNCARLCKPHNEEVNTDLEGLLSSGYEMIRASPRSEEAVLLLSISGGSKTRSGRSLVPEIILIPNNKSTIPFLYNCPEFHGTSADKDIAVNFFMTQFAKKVDRVKMLFLVQHSSVTTEENDFDLLAERASKFVKNLPKYRNSIGLVVTNVSSYSEQGEFVEDNIVLAEIKEFLTNFNQTLHSKLASETIASPLRQEILGKINFVEAILQENDNDEYPKIHILKSVENCGVLGEFPEIVKSNKKVIAALSTHFESTPVDLQDFGYTLPDKAIASIYQLGERSNAAISKNVEVLRAHFEKWYNQKSLSTNNISALLENAEKDQLILENLMNLVIPKSNSNPAQFAQVLTTHLEKFSGYSVPSSFDVLMKRQQAFFDFFDAAVVSTLERNVRDWLAPIQLLHSSLSNLSYWLDFCVNLQSKLYSYNFQVGKKRDLVVPQGGQNTDWLKFIQKNGVLSVNWRIRSIAPTVHRKLYKVLSDLMEFALVPTRNTCTGRSLTVTGNFVYLSEFVNKTSDGFRTSCPGGNITKLEVYSSRTIFIDADLSMIGKELNVVLIAPIWVVVGKRVLDLSGAPVDDIQPPRAYGGSLHTKGSNGLPGQHGGPAGSFFGVVGKVGKGSELQIWTNGGNGGKGQHGGNYDYQGHPPQFLKGKGGDGGAGGLGGVAGSLILVAVDSGPPPSIQLHSKPGKVGAPGEGGTGFIPGKSNLITSGRLPLKQRVYTIHEWRSVLNFKKSFFGVEESDGDRFKKGIETSSALERYFNVKAYAVEFMELEENSLRTGVNLERVEFGFKSCKNRMESYVERNRGKLTLEERKVLAMLLSSATSKLLNLAQTNDFGVVIDVTHFFTYLKQQLTQLKTVRASVAVEETRMAFNEKINEKVGQVKGFIADVVNPVLKSAEEGVGMRLNSLARTFRETLYFAEKDLERNKALLEKEKSTLWIKGLLDVLQGALGVLSFFDPTGITGLVNGGISMAQGAMSSTDGGGSGGGVSPLVGHATKLVNDGNAVKQMLATSTKLDNSSVSLNETQVSVYWGDGVASLLREYKNDKEKLSRTEALVREAELMVAEFRDRTQLLKRFVPVVDAMLSHFNVIKSKLEAGEQPLASELDVRKWQATRALQEVKSDLEILAGGMNERGLLRAIDAVKDAFTMMLDLYKNIEEYQDTKDLADYMAAMTSATLNSVKINDPELKLLAPKLEVFMKENILRREYKMGVHAFKQWIFPFAKMQLTQFQNAGGNSSNLNGRDLSDLYVAEIDKLLAQLQRYKATTLSAQDTYIIKTNFSSEHRSSHPFFVWSNDKFETEIGQLLEGKKVHFKADVRESTRGRDAVKFSQIEINFKIPVDKSTAELEKELTDKLKDFSVTMTYLGLSKYRFQDGIYVMTGPNQTIVYNFERDSKGSRLGTNEIYRKFASGDFLLSPYTTWAIQLKKSVPNNNVSFENLQKFVSLVDLELVGTGVYVDPDLLKVDLELDVYYVRDERVES